MTRIKGVRKKLSQELGFLIQPVHIRDNLDLSPNSYRMSLLGVPMGEAEMQPGRDLAINPGTVYGELSGTRPRIRPSASTLTGSNRRSAIMRKPWVIPWLMRRP